MEANSIGQACFLMLGSVLEPKSAAYVAGPLDTGKTYFDSLVSGPGSLPAEDIRTKNEDKLTRFAQSLRKKIALPVIDPGPLRIPGWTGRDYGIFFLSVIDTFVLEVWFIDGWEFSSGATKEFTHCIRSGIKCLDERGLLISVEDGRSKIESAIRYVESLGLDPQKLRSHLP